MRVGRLETRATPAVSWSVLVATLLPVLASAWDEHGVEIRRDAVVRAVEKVMPSVVNIAAKTRVQRMSYYYEWWRDNWTPYAQELPPQESAGSGVIIDESGIVLTNVHVVEEADEIWVKIVNPSGETKIYQATPIVGSFTTDVALLKLQTNEEERFTVARFAANDDLLLGETVIALGNPFGLGGSVSKGILSAKSRRQDTSGGRLEVPDWLQTDASINPGNSGGPLINLEGEVIGINVAVLKEGQGIGFAIPIKRVNESLSTIYTPEILGGLWFGARIKAASDFPLVETVEAGSPAERGGLRQGDQILSMNGRPLRSYIDLGNRLHNLGRDRNVNFKVLRGGKKNEILVKLIPEKAIFNAGLIRQKTGASFEVLSPDVAEVLGLSDRTSGLVISRIDRDTPAAQAQLKPGWVVVSVDGQRVDDIVDAARILYGKQSGDEVELEFVYARRRGLFVRHYGGQATLHLL